MNAAYNFDHLGVLASNETDNPVELLDGLGRVKFTPEWWDAGDADEEWALRPFLPKGRGVSIFAPAGIGKSLLMLFFAAAKATGTEGQTAGNVLYCDYEMTHADLRERLGDMGYGPRSDLSGLIYLSLPSLPPLNTREGGQQLLAAADAAHAEVVIIDTFSRAVDGVENDAGTAQDYYRWTGSPLKASGYSVLRCDHTGKIVESGARGSSAKRDDVDIAWSLSICQMTDGARGFNLKIDKGRLSWIPETVTLRQHADPLRFTYENEPGWPAGTAPLAAVMDCLGIDLALSSRKVIEVLQQAGENRSKNVVLAAIRYRKSRDRSGSGTTLTGAREP